MRPYLFPLILVLLILFFFGQASLGSEVIVSGDLSGSDLLDLHYPFKAAINDALKNGYFPLWTPYLDTGYPLLGEGQMGLFYPINLLLSPLPPFLALNYSIILAFATAGATSYAYARLIGLKPFSAFVTAVTFTFSSFFVTRAKHINIIFVASLFPLGLFWLTRFWQSTKMKYLVLLGITLGWQILAGHPQMAFYCAIVYILAFAWELIFFARSKQPLPLGQALTGLVLAGLIGLGIGAVQFLPTLEMTLLSSRPTYVYEQIAMYPYHPKNLITLFSPYYFGNPAAGTYRENIQVSGIFWENATYVGLLPLALALYAIFCLVRKDKKVLFFVITAIFSLLLMLGRFTPIFLILVKSLPLAGLFRFPTRFGLFFVFSLSILAGFGSQILVDKLTNFQYRGRFRWPLSIQRTQILIALVIVIDLFTIGRDYLGAVKTSEWIKTPESVKFLKNDKSFFRIYSVSQYNESPYQVMGWKRTLKPHLAMREAIPPNANIGWQLPTISDRSWFEGGLPTLRHYQFENWLLKDIQNEYMLGKVLGMFNVKYLITFMDTANSELVLEKEIDLGSDFGTSLKIYENKQFMDRLFFVPQALVIAKPDEILAKMAGFDFLPTREVILEKKPPVLPDSFSGNLNEFAKENQVKIEAYQPLSVEIRANLKNAGFLVLSDTPYPGWKATIDGKQSEIYTANFMQRALYMQPGEHKVRFFYDPLYFKIGAGITGVTIVVIGGWGMIYISRKLLGRKKEIKVGVI